MPSTTAYVPYAHTPILELTETGWSYYGSAKRIRIETSMTSPPVVRRPLSPELPAKAIFLHHGSEYVSTGSPIIVEAMRMPSAPPSGTAVLLRIHGQGVHTPGDPPFYLEGIRESDAVIEWVIPRVVVRKPSTTYDGWIAEVHFPGTPPTLLPLGEVGHPDHSFGYVKSYLLSLFHSTVICLE